MTDKKTVLVVDDEESMRTAVGLKLRALGYAVITAEDHEDAADKLAAGVPALVITDFNYPGANFDNNTGGADTVALLNSKYPDVPVIVMSGLPDDFKVMAQKRGLQYQALFSKPLGQSAYDMVALLTATAPRGGATATTTATPLARPAT